MLRKEVLACSFQHSSPGQAFPKTLRRQAGWIRELIHSLSQGCVSHTPPEASNSPCCHLWAVIDRYTTAGFEDFNIRHQRVESPSVFWRPFNVVASLIDLSVSKLWYWKWYSIISKLFTALSSGYSMALSMVVPQAFWSSSIIWDLTLYSTTILSGNMRKMGWA